MNQRCTNLGIKHVKRLAPRDCPVRHATHHSGQLSNCRATNIPFTLFGNWNSTEIKNRNLVVSISVQVGRAFVKADYKAKQHDSVEQEPLLLAKGSFEVPVTKSTSGHTLL